MQYSATNIKPQALFSSGSICLEVSERLEGTHDYNLVNVDTGGVACCGTKAMLAMWLSVNKYEPTYIHRTVWERVKLCKFKDTYFLLSLETLELVHSAKTFKSIKSYLKKHNYS